MDIDKSKPVRIREVTADDGQALADIYNYYIAKTIVTFEEEPVTAGEMAQRVAGVQEVALPWLVATRGEVLVGYAYATPWRGRWGYRFSKEVTVYVAHGQGGQGIGTMLYRQLLDGLRTLRVHTAIGGIALPNVASVLLHEKMGFRKVAQFEHVGIKFGKWIDVGFWQYFF